MTPEEKAALQRAVDNIVQAFDLVRSALTNFSVQLAEIETETPSLGEGLAGYFRRDLYEDGCENCGEDAGGYPYCSEECAVEMRTARYGAAAGSDEEPCPPFCDEHETCREDARLHSASRLGFAWTREQGRLREELLNSPYPEYTVIVEHTETAAGSGDRARIPVMGLSEWITRDDDHDWYLDPYEWGVAIIAAHLGVSRNDFDVQVIRPEAPGPVKDRRPVYGDPHANPEDDVIRRITWLEDEPELNTGGYVVMNQVTGERQIRPQPRHRQDLGARQARETMTALFSGADIEEVY